MQLEDFFDYKNQLMEDLLTNRKIVELLSNDRKIREEPEKLMYTQVFPYEYIPDTIEDATTFICCDVDVQQAINKTFLSPVLYIWIFTHKSLQRLPNGEGVRTDKLAAEIARTINGSRMYGLGELDLYSTRRFAPVIEYLGKTLTFQMTEFNRFTPSGKPVPTNRKRG